MLLYVCVCVIGSLARWVVVWYENKFDATGITAASMRGDVHFFVRFGTHFGFARCLLHNTIAVHI